MDDISGARINKCLDPSTSLIVLDLNDVCENKRVIFLDNKFQSRGVVVELPAKSGLSLGDGLLNCEGRCGGRRPEIRCVTTNASDFSMTNNLGKMLQTWFDK